MSVLRCLVIGGTRFIGAATVRRLVARGHAVTVLHRGRTEAPLPATVRHLHGDRVDLGSSLHDEIARLAPQVVIDMVAYTEQHATTAIAALSALTPGAHVVVISSVDVYRAFDRYVDATCGPLQPVPLDEDAPLRTSRYPRRGRAAGPDDWRHDYDKILVEQAYRSAPSLSATMLRLAFVYGRDDYRRRLQPLLQTMAAQPELRIDRSQAGWRCTRGYVDNVAAAIDLAAVDPRAAGRIYNVGEAEALSEIDWARRVGAAAGLGCQVLATDQPAGPDGDRIGWDQDVVVDTSRLRRELGYVEPVDPLEGLRRSVTWQKAR